MLPNAATNGRVLQGTCGWSDASLVKCGRFYPASVKTSDDKLAFYSSKWPCVEVDTTTYAIPRPTQVEKWVHAVRASPGFVFHVKAFGLFPGKTCSLEALPAEVRQTLPTPLQQGRSSRGSGSSVGGGLRVSLSDLGMHQVGLVWAAFHDALAPLASSGRLGCVVFQFHLGFGPSAENRRHVRWCRDHLDKRFTMCEEAASLDTYSLLHFSAQ